MCGERTGQFRVLRVHRQFAGIGRRWELLQNAFEHGLRDRGHGRITVTTERRGRRLQVCVIDDGAGLPAGFDPDRDAKLGLQIVQTLVRDDLVGFFELGSRGSRGWGPPPPSTWLCRVAQGRLSRPGISNPR